MKELILKNIDDPAALEQLYRSDGTRFKSDFNAVYEQIEGHIVAKVWNERIKATEPSISWGFKYEWLVVIIITFFAGLVAKMPHILSIDEDFYFTRNIGFVVFPFLTLYIAWRSGVYKRGLFISSIVFLISVVYINLLPDNPESDTLKLASLHLPLFLWSVFGYSYLKKDFQSHERRLSFLRYNGDLAVMMAILTISGGILTALTVGMFSLIEVDMEYFFENIIVFWAAPAIPIVATFLIKTNPRIVNLVSPIIAKIFTPIVLITLVVYLGAVLFSGKDPYNDRDFLLIFNLILIGVMAIILFSMIEASKNQASRWGTGLLFSLSVVAIILNSIALSAILYRLLEYGITPNRFTVMGGNVLILINLVIVSMRLFLTTFKEEEIHSVGESISSFLPFYGIWTLIVVFVIPIMFGFR